jgi:hypothetical protein
VFKDFLGLHFAREPFSRRLMLKTPSFWDIFRSVQFSSKRIAEIGRELDGLEERKQLLLAELEQLVQLGRVESVDSQSGSQEFSRRVRAVGSKICDLLDSDRSREFTAEEIKRALQIPQSQSKTFYSALIKLMRKQRLSRTGRALYKSHSPSKEFTLSGERNFAKRPLTDDED